ncbi:hypothetical protein M758_1G121000 [Ceratodon purpureus]|nr:hypothetical protein M758_1G121000 [Ceratodon purpureus]
MSNSSVNYEALVSQPKRSVDLSKPIVAQVGLLGADYDDWVHQPVTRKETPRFFESDILEMGTKAKWWMIPLIWGPVVVMCEARAVQKGLSPSQAFPGFIAGVLAWTFVEYLLHRFVFHMKTSSYWGNTFHYVIHGFHHKHPMDANRLVFPPVMALFIAIPVWYLMKFLIPYRAVCYSLYGGMFMGYIMYDLTHYFLHFGTAFSDHLYKMKKDHSNHHFKNQMHNYGFGVTSSFWDVVFSTLPPTKLKSHQAVGSQPSTVESY